MLVSSPSPDPAHGGVLRIRLAPERVDDAVREARAWFHARGRERFAWYVGEEAEPPDARSRVEERGAVPDERDPLLTGMVLTDAPPSVPGLEIRRVETQEDYRAVHELAWASFGLEQALRDEARAGLAGRWERYGRPGAPTLFLALEDGEPIGSGGLLFASTAGYLAGGNVRGDRRGRGVYRALVRARWDAAAERGAPALVVQAGRMSKPILERLGFRAVTTIHVLIDSSHPDDG